MTGLKLNTNCLNSHFPCRFRIPFGIRLAFHQVNMYVESVEDEHNPVRVPSWKCFREPHDWNRLEYKTSADAAHWRLFPAFKILAFHWLSDYLGPVDEGLGRVWGLVLGMKKN